MKKNTLLLGLILTSLAGFSYANDLGLGGTLDSATGKYTLIIDEAINASYVAAGGYGPVENGTKLVVSSPDAELYECVHGGAWSGAVKGDIHVDFLAGKLNSWLVGGNHSDSIVDGNIYINVTGGEVYGIRAGSFGPDYLDRVVTGSAEVYIGGNATIGIGATANGDEAFSVAGGAGSIQGNLTLTIADNATILADIYGGGGRTFAGNAGNNIKVDKNSVENVAINVKGGNIQANVYGGALKYSSVESTSINISGGVIEKNVYAGGGEGGSGKNTVVNTNANINISGGVVKGNVYASGSNDTAKVLGTSTVTLTNNAKVEGTIHGRTLGSTEDGAKVLNFGTVANEQNVAFNGKVNVANFDTINVEGNSNAEIGTYQALKGGTTINIASGSTLTLNLAGNVFSSTSLENAGSLVLNKGSYTGDTVEFKAYNANGGTVYGGWFDGYTLNFGTKTEKESSAISADAPAIVQKAETLIIADNSATGEDGKSDASMKVNQVSISASSNENANVVVNNAEVVDFTVDTFSATGMDEVAMENILTVWTFDVEGVSEENGVVLSFVVGEGFDINAAKIWHRSNADSNWEDVSDKVSGLTYDGNTLSFIATEFSDYSVTVVPEPAEWAAIFGAIALGFVIYRRRK